VHQWNATLATLAMTSKYQGKVLILTIAVALFAAFDGVESHDYYTMLHGTAMAPVCESFSGIWREGDARCSSQYI
jgi:Na+/proline symporter